MRKILVFLGVLVLLAVPAAAASCSSGSLTASLGKQFTLPIGKTVAISGQDLKIGFEDVNGDSRCAIGNTCVWEGEAKCRGALTYGGQMVPIIFTINGSSATDQPLASGYMAHYTLEPYPVAGQTIAHDEYKLLMIVTKE